MSLGEAFFWVGLTVLGSTTYIFVDRYLNSPILLALVTIVSVGAVGYPVYLHYHPEVPNPSIWMFLPITVWCLVGYALSKSRGRMEMKIRNLSAPQLGDTVIQKLEKVGKLRSLAGQADWLDKQLVDIWHQFNNSGRNLIYPIGKGEIPDKIETPTDKQLWMFRVWYQSLLGSMKVIDPDCDSTLMKDGFPAQRQYQDVERNIKEHAEVLQKRAADLLTSAKNEHIENQKKLAE
jgi:hypothetical protein